MSDLIKRLYKTPLYEGSGEGSELGEEAADEITSLTARVKELEAEVERLKTAMTQAIRQHEEGNRELSHRTLCDAVYGEQNENA